MRHLLCRRARLDRVRHAGEIRFTFIRQRLLRLRLMQGRIDMVDNTGCWLQWRAGLYTRIDRRHRNDNTGL